jgi:hypothetical protein
LARCGIQTEGKSSNDSQNQCQSPRQPNLEHTEEASVTGGSTLPLGLLFTLSEFDFLLGNLLVLDNFLLDNLLLHNLLLDKNLLLDNPLLNNPLLGNLLYFKVN